MHLHKVFHTNFPKIIIFIHVSSLILIIYLDSTLLHAHLMLDNNARATWELFEMFINCNFVVTCTSLGVNSTQSLGHLEANIMQRVRFFPHLGVQPGGLLTPVQHRYLVNEAQTCLSKYFFIV